jgi:hypothetical protein
MKKELDFFNPCVHPSSTTKKYLSWKILKPKCDNKYYEKCQIIKLEIEMRLKIKWITFATLFI